MAGHTAEANGVQCAQSAQDVSGLSVELTRPTKEFHESASVGDSYTKAWFMASCTTSILTREDKQFRLQSELSVRLRKCAASDTQVLDSLLNAFEAFRPIGLDQIRSLKLQLAAFPTTRFPPLTAQTLKAVEIARVLHEAQSLMDMFAYFTIKTKMRKEELDKEYAALNEELHGLTEGAESINVLSCDNTSKNISESHRRFEPLGQFRLYVIGSVMSSKEEEQRPRLLLSTDANGAITMKERSAFPCSLTEIMHARWPPSATQVLEQPCTQNTSLSDSKTTSAFMPELHSTDAPFESQPMGLALPDFAISQGNAKVEVVGHAAIPKIPVDNNVSAGVPHGRNEGWQRRGSYPGGKYDIIQLPEAEASFVCSKHRSIFPDSRSHPANLQLAGIKRKRSLCCGFSNAGALSTAPVAQNHSGHKDSPPGTEAAPQHADGLSVDPTVPREQAVQSRSPSENYCCSTSPRGCYYMNSAWHGGGPLDIGKGLINLPPDPRDRSIGRLEVESACDNFTDNFECVWEKNAPPTRLEQERLGVYEKEEFVHPRPIAASSDPETVPPIGDASLLGPATHRKEPAVDSSSTENCCCSTSPGRRYCLNSCWHGRSLDVGEDLDQSLFTLILPRYLNDREIERLEVESACDAIADDLDCVEHANASPMLLGQVCQGFSRLGGTCQALCCSAADGNRISAPGCFWGRSNIA